MEYFKFESIYWFGSVRDLKDGRCYRVMDQSNLYSRKFIDEVGRLRSLIHYRINPRFLSLEEYIMEISKDDEN